MSQSQFAAIVYGKGVCMNKLMQQIKDACRENLIQYTDTALSMIPPIDRPLILDLGCGTGVTALYLAGKCNGTVYAVDADQESVSWLNRKIKAAGLSERIVVRNASVFEPELFPVKFDVVLAEGLLNATGIEKGLAVLYRYAKPGGYLLIHEGLQYDAQMNRAVQAWGLKSIHSFIIEETVWWNEYYRCLEQSIQERNLGQLFETQQEEIRAFQSNPESSVFYILQKETPKQ